MPTEIPKTHSLATTQSGISHRWYWLAALLLLAAVAYLAWVAQRSVKRSVADHLEGVLVGTLQAKTAALETWLDALQRTTYRSLASGRLSEALLQAVRWQDESQGAEYSENESYPNLELVLAPTIELLGASGYFVTDRTGRFVASSNPEWVGERLPPEYNKTLPVLMQNKAAVVATHPQKFSSEPLLGRGGHASNGEHEIQLSIMAPIYHESHQDVGTVGFLISPSGAFSQLLNIGSTESCIEVYSVNSQAQLLSTTGFEEFLKETGFVQRISEDAVHILVRDPGTDLNQAGATNWTPAACPMTTSAAGVATASALDDASISTQLTAYRNYRGLWVVGAWSWRPEYQLGIIAEMPDSTAFAVVHRLELALWGLIGLLAVSLGGTLFFARAAQAILRRLGKAEKKLAKLGQYELLEKIGQGGMGEVYRAHHALLRRETAVKICKLDKSSTSANYRFQREVQAASQLNNPHTVRIFDYGQSEGGTFFYAMELLHGVNLTGLIRQFGTLADGRTIYILKQVCESLAEAHGLGLVHRDIKPSNVMIGRRGGVADFVKVLDFGLVRSFGANRTVSLTLDGCVAGTPHYMSPEASQNPQDVDPRSDLYSVGCLAFHLLCGQPPFKGSNPLEICLKQVREDPPAIREQCPSPICDQLSDIVMRCLAKTPTDRPQSALELMAELDLATPLHPWSRSDAELWWRNNAEIAQKVMVAGPDTQATMNTKTPS